MKSAAWVTGLTLSCWCSGDLQLVDGELLVALWRLAACGIEVETWLIYATRWVPRSGLTWCVVKHIPFSSSSLEKKILSREKRNG